MAKPTVTVKVQLMVEVTTSTWDASVSYNAIKEQSVKEAKCCLGQLVKIHGNNRVTIIGEPQAVTVTMTADPREK